MLLKLMRLVVLLSRHRTSCILVARRATCRVRVVSIVEMIPLFSFCARRRSRGGHECRSGCPGNASTMGVESQADRLLHLYLFSPELQLRCTQRGAIVHRTTKWVNVNVISVDADDEVVPLSFDCRAFRLQVRKPSDSLMKDVGEAMRSEDR